MSYGSVSDMKPSLWERIVVIFMARAPMATGVGIGLELIAWMMFGFLFGPTPMGRWVLDNDSVAFHAIFFSVFHIFGWLISWHQWPVMTGQIPDKWEMEEEVASNEFVIEHDNYIISGRVTYREE